jgi:xanthine dehydrogenase YagS FAD-binding subunit
MRSFSHKNAASVQEAVRLLAQGAGRALPVAGGSDLLEELKDGIQRPSSLVHLRTIPALDKVQQKGEFISIGALVTIADVADDLLLQKLFPVFTEAAAVIASPQIRNVGTVGGNLCQRPRCWYYRGAFHCLRKGGGICFAKDGENRYHAILGGGPSYIVHPSDLAPALISLDAKVRIAGPAGERVIPLEQFFVLPTVDFRHENILKPGEILTEILVPKPLPEARSTYWKQMERDTWDFALASAAVVVRQRDGKIDHARVVMGGVAPIPWRSKDAEASLVGKPLDSVSIAAAADKALAHAQPMGDNAYKVDLAKATIRRSLSRLSDPQHS